MRSLRGSCSNSEASLPSYLPTAPTTHRLCPVLATTDGHLRGQPPHRHRIGMEVHSRCRRTDHFYRGHNHRRVRDPQPRCRRCHCQEPRCGRGEGHSRGNFDRPRFHAVHTRPPAPTRSARRHRPHGCRNPRRLPACRRRCRDRPQHISPRRGQRIRLVRPRCHRRCCGTKRSVHNTVLCSEQGRDSHTATGRRLLSARRT